MVSIAGFLSQFFAVLIATLIGVFFAFRLDRFQQRRQTQQRAADHLRSIKSEIHSNAERVEKNNEVVKQLRRRSKEGHHYILEPLDTDAWLAALQEPIVGTISNDLYEKLQMTYSEVKAINSLIDRQKGEMHHAALGSTEGMGTKTYEVWTMNVDYYDTDDDEVDYFGLGPLIQKESKSLQDVDELTESIEDEIDRLE